MIGELSKYEKKTLTFSNAANNNNWDNGAVVPCSFEPKLIIFHGGSENNGNIIRGCFVFAFDNTNIDVGGVYYKNNATSNFTTQGYRKNTTAGASYFKYDNGNFYATRVSNNAWWSNSDSYTFEIYG